jgi:Tol biopolymer transport system component
MIKAICGVCLCLSIGSMTLAAEEPVPEGREESLSNIVQLTSGFEKAGEAYFSPDMNWIIFQATPKGQAQYQMFVAKLKRETGEQGGITGIEAPTQISPEPSRNTCGYFSPDGNHLIFASTAGREKPDEPTSGYQREGGSYRWAFPEGMEIFITQQPHGWQEQVEAAGPGGKVDLATHALTRNDVYDAEGAFSPDGKWICYTSKVNDNLDVYVMPLHSQIIHGPGTLTNHANYRHLVPGTPIRITTAPGYDGGPFFSPDGKRLVYRSDRQNNNLLQIFVADLAFDDKGNITGVKAEHQLTDDVNVNWGPSWHPDNKHLIYATSKHGHTNYELYLMRDDGSHQTRITYSPGADILPVFSPDGKYLMWTSKRSKDQTSQVFIAKFTMPKGA